MQMRKDNGKINNGLGIPKYLKIFKKLYVFYTVSYSRTVPLV